MTTDQPIETQAVIVADQSPSRLSLEQVHADLQFVRQVMAREMVEGQDYGKIPGCGDKPGLFQPGAQKLLLTFQLTPEVKKEVLRELPHPTVAGHREYEFTLTLRSKTGRGWDGVGTCSTFESKYRYRKGSRRCPECNKETIFKDKKGPGYYCWAKKGGCGTQFKDEDSIRAIESQQCEDTEFNNPADYWNTVRKMAFKRALVHGAINATNTSELWSQDLEDLPQSTAPVSQSREYYEEGTTESFKEVGPPDGGFDADDAPQAKPEPPKATPATTKTRSWAIGKIGANEPGPRRTCLYNYMVALKWIKPDNTVEAWPLDKVPTNGADLQKLLIKLGNFEADGRAEA